MRLPAVTTPRWGRTVLYHREGSRCLRVYGVSGWISPGKKHDVCESKWACVPSTARFCVLKTRSFFWQPKVFWIVVQTSMHCGGLAQTSAKNQCIPGRLPLRPKFRLWKIIRQYQMCKIKNCMVTTPNDPKNNMITKTSSLRVSIPYSEKSKVLNVASAEMTSHAATVWVLHLAYCDEPLLKCRYANICLRHVWGRNEVHV